MKLRKRDVLLRRAAFQSFILPKNALILAARILAQALRTSARIRMPAP